VWREASGLRRLTAAFARETNIVQLESNMVCEPDNPKKFGIMHLTSFGSGIVCRANGTPISRSARIQNILPQADQEIGAPNDANTQVLIRIDLEKNSNHEIHERKPAFVCFVCFVVK
jgi:hypothetical protein